MSPNVYSKIQGHNKTATYDQKKNDYHALGMTLLNLGVQDSLNGYYNENGSVNSNVLSNQIQKFSNKYADQPNLVHAVQTMTNPDEKLRNIDFTRTNNLVQNTPNDVRTDLHTQNNLTNQ